MNVIVPASKGEGGSELYKTERRDSTGEASAGETITAREDSTQRAGWEDDGGLGALSSRDRSGSLHLLENPQGPLSAGQTVRLCCSSMRSNGPLSTEPFVSGKKFAAQQRLGAGRDRLWPEARGDWSVPALLQ